MASSHHHPHLIDCVISYTYVKFVMYVLYLKKNHRFSTVQERLPHGEVSLLLSSTAHLISLACFRQSLA